MILDNEQDIIEAVVEDFRLRHGIPDDIRPDMADLLMRMRIAGTIKGFFSRGEGYEFAGEYDPEEDVIAVSAKALARQSRRDRFTIAHEIGHKLAGHESATRYRRADGRKQFGRQVGRDEEIANAFAAALLIPERLAQVDGQTTAAELADRFNVSLPMAELRLKTLQRRYRVRLGIKRPLPVKLYPDLSRKAEVDSGDYDQAMSTMYKNWTSWNS